MKSKTWYVTYYLNDVQFDETEVNGSNAREALDVALDIIKDDLKNKDISEINKLSKYKNGVHCISINIEYNGIEKY